MGVEMREVRVPKPPPTTPPLSVSVLMEKLQAHVHNPTCQPVVYAGEKAYREMFGSVASNNYRPYTANLVGIAQLRILGVEILRSVDLGPDMVTVLCHHNHGFSHRPSVVAWGTFDGGE